MNAKLSPAVDLAHLTAQLGWGKGEEGGSSPDVDIPQANPPLSLSPHPTGRGSRTGHMCKLSASPPSRCEPTLIIADRQAPTVT